jgi:DNA excision repair protein ERCC-4
MVDAKGFTIVVDTREQRPYRFAGAVRKALRSGDYSVLGGEARVAVERKEKTDAYSSLGRGRKRFERELARLAEFEYAAVVIEAGLTEFLDPPAFSRMHPHAAVNTLVSWSVKYGVHVFFADSRRLARALTYRILEKFWKHRGTTDGKRP